MIYRGHRNWKACMIDRLWSYVNTSWFHSAWSCIKSVTSPNSYLLTYSAVVWSWAKAGSVLCTPYMDRVQAWLSIELSYFEKNPTWPTNMTVPVYLFITVCLMKHIVEIYYHAYIYISGNYLVSRCTSSLYKSSFLKSVINLD